MKVLITGLLLAISFFAQAQDLSVLNQFKYLIVQTSMYEGARDPYNVSTYLRQRLFALGYNVIPENEVAWPEELRLNPCLGVRIDVITTPKVVGDYISELLFMNCYNIDVLTLEGKGSGDGSDKAFQNALERAIRDFKKFEHNFQPELAMLPLKGKTIVADSVISYFRTADLEPFEGLYDFKSGNIYYKIGIKKEDKLYNAYILESDNQSWIPGQIKGSFEMSNRPGLFSVEWFLDDKSSYDTFGYINDDKSLTIEFKKPGDEYQPLQITKIK